MSKTKNTDKAERAGLMYLPISLDQIIQFYFREVMRKELLLVNYWVDTGKNMAILEAMKK